MPRPPDMIPSCSLCWRAVKGSDGRRELKALSTLLDYSIAMASPSPSLMDRPPSTVTLDQHPDKLQTDYRLLPTY